jgi:hypothetical protein
MYVVHGVFIVYFRFARPASMPLLLASLSAMDNLVVAFAALAHNPHPQAGALVCVAASVPARAVDLNDGARVGVLVLARLPARALQPPIRRGSPACHIVGGSEHSTAAMPMGGSSQWTAVDILVIVVVVVASPAVVARPAAAHQGATCGRLVAIVALVMPAAVDGRRHALALHLAGRAIPVRSVRACVTFLKSSSKHIKALSQRRHT